MWTLHHEMPELASQLTWQQGQADPQSTCIHLDLQPNSPLTYGMAPTHSAGKGHSVPAISHSQDQSWRSVMMTACSKPRCDHEMLFRDPGLDR